MKKYIYTFIACLTAFNLLANSVSEDEDSLLQTLTPKYESSLQHFQGKENSIESVSRSKKKKKQQPTISKAYAVNIEIREGATVHVGYYTDCFVVTYMNDPSGTFPIGAQVAATLDATPIGYSTTYVNEVVNGISYAKHIHDTCYVYSSDFSQFIVTK